MRIFSGLLATLCLVMSSGAWAAELGLAFESPDWSGKKVPGVGICQLHGGQGMSPAITVTSIPAETNRLVMKFTDRDWGSEGAHGVVGFRHAPDTPSTTIPSFKGEVDALPEVFEKISIHECRACGGGIYLGPCSGGQGHQYHVTIEAQNAAGKTLAEGKLVLGVY
jgi:phosphatidylethanolamine-binding protein (PEBP) family uncharacterized protein